MRFILIEVDDDTAADKLVEKFSTIKSARVAGIFQIPRTRCQCKGYVDIGHRAGNSRRLLRGSKFLWWVHDICGRCPKGQHNLYNMLPQERRLADQNGRDLPTYVNYISMHDRGWGYQDL